MDSPPQAKGGPTIGVVPTQVTTAPQGDITTKQADYIRSLLDRTGKTEHEVSDYFGFVITDCYKEEASEVIQWLKSQPAKQQQATYSDLDVPPGRYGLLYGGATEEYQLWKFYQVDRPTKGKWAGRTFLSVLASDEKHPVRDPVKRAATLNRIAENPAKAAKDYGQQTGRCGVCNRLLTDPESIQAGIGPVCAARF